MHIQLTLKTSNGDTIFKKNERLVYPIVFSHGGTEHTEFTKENSEKSGFLCVLVPL